MQSGGMPNNPTWPGQPGSNPTWPEGQPGVIPPGPWGQPGGNPTWPGRQPGTIPVGPWGQQGMNPTWPGGQPGPNPAWPGGQGMWPAGNPVQPIGPCPVPNPEVPQIVPGNPFGSGPNIAQQNLNVPYALPLPYGVYDKMLITIHGTVKPNANKFSVNLCTGSDVAFHFNPRFNESGKPVIVRNTLVGNNWGKEERDLPLFPFVRGQPFEMQILCTNTEFRVAVNKAHLFEYKHRIPNLRSINNLKIEHDLSLSYVNMETLS